MNIGKKYLNHLIWSSILLIALLMGVYFDTPAWRVFISIVAALAVFIAGVAVFLVREVLDLVKDEFCIRIREAGDD